MVAIISPQPRIALPPFPSTPSPQHMSTPPIYLSDELSRRTTSQRLLSPPRLLSPIRLTDSSFDKFNLSPHSCISTKRRKALSKASSSRSSRRRHQTHYPRPSDCPFFSSPGVPVFDSLPWISNLDVEPERLNPWDIADLSLLPVDESGPEHEGAELERPAPGPIRRRKTSLRSNPFAGGDGIAQRRSPSPGVMFPLDASRRPPRTPPPMRERFDPTLVRFQGLMPVYPESA